MTVTAAKKLPKDIGSVQVPVGDSPFAVDGERDDIPPMPTDLMPETKSKPDTILIIEALKKMYATIGAGLYIFPSTQIDSLLIVSNAEELAESWRYLLDNDAKMRRTMRKLIQGSGWGTVISIHVGVAVALLKNHPNGISHLIKRKEASSIDQ